MNESIHIKVESPAAPAVSAVSAADNGIIGIDFRRERVVPTSTWDKDNYEPSLVYPRAPIFGHYDATSSPDYRDKHSYDPYAARSEESQDRPGAVGASASEGDEGVIQPEMGGDNPPDLEEGDPPVSVKVEDTPLGEDCPTLVKTESQDTPILDFSNVPHSLSRVSGGIVGSTSQTAPLKTQFSETSMFDLSTIPHHVGDEQVAYSPAAFDPRPEPRPEPSQFPRSSKKSVSQEEMTDKNINQMDGMDIGSKELVNSSAATTTLPEHAPLGLITNVKRNFGKAQASTSETAGGPFTNRIDDRHVHQDSNAGNGKEPAAFNNQEVTFDSAQTIQYHDPHRKTAGRPIPQVKSKPDASRASGESILARASTSARPPRRSAAEFLELFEKETQSGKYPCTGEDPMDLDLGDIDGPAKKYKPSRRQRKKLRETKEAARASEAAESVRASEGSESARVSEVAESVEDTNTLPAGDLAALYAHAGMVPGDSSSELSSLSDSTGSLAGPEQAAEETKSSYNHPSQRLIIRNSDPVPDIALCRAGESVADARARLGLPPRAIKKKATSLWDL